jgi:hypothetical protein
MGGKMTLLLAPEEYALYGGGYIQARPLPLALGVLQGALRAAGHRVSAYDLSPAIEAERDPRAWLALYDLDGVLESLGRAGKARCARDWTRSSTRRTSPIATRRAVDRRKLLHLRNACGISAGRADHRTLWQARGRRRRERGPPDAVYLDVQAADRGYLQARRHIPGRPGDESLPSFLEGVGIERLPGAVRLEGGEPVRNPVAAPSFVRPDFDSLPLEPYAVSFRRMGNPPEEAREAGRQLFGVSMARSQSISARNGALPPFLKREALVLPFYFNHGCVFNCAFCVQSREDWSPFVSMKAEAAVKDLKALSERHGTPYVRFFNNAFNLSGRFVREFCDAAEREGLHIRFSDCGRFNGLTREDAFRLYGAGCRKLVFGWTARATRF